MDSRLMQINEWGNFKGSAEIATAEIDGALTVRQKLVTYSTGKIRSGKLVDYRKCTSPTSPRTPMTIR